MLFLEEHLKKAGERLQDPAFAEAILITPYNDALFYFAQKRAINYARATGAASFWIQAADAPPAWFTSGYTTEDLLELKEMAVLSCAQNGWHLVLVAGLLQHAVQDHTRPWPGLQEVRHSQRISLQTKSLGFR